MTEPGPALGDAEQPVHRTAAEEAVLEARQALSPEARQAVAGAAKWWWLFLVAAAAWLAVAFVVFQFSTTSLATVGIIIGAMLLFAGVEQFLAAAVVGGMKWLFWFFGAVFIVFGVIALFNPLTTAASVAASLGLILAMIGAFWAIESIFARSVNSLWGLGLVSGIVMIGLGIWLGNQGLGQKTLSLLVFAGVWALMHAFTDVMRAFQLKRVGELVSREPRLPVA